LFDKHKAIYTQTYIVKLNSDQYVFNKLNKLNMNTIRE
jgi:hypothetical protein